MIKFEPCGTFSKVYVWKNERHPSLAWSTSFGHSDSFFTAHFPVLQFHGKPNKTDGRNHNMVVLLLRARLSTSRKPDCPPMMTVIPTFTNPLAEADREESDHSLGKITCSSSACSSSLHFSFWKISMLATWRQSWEGVTKPLSLFFLIWPRCAFNNY